MKRRSRLLHPNCKPYFCAVFDCLLAILLKFIDNTGTVQFASAIGQDELVWL